MDFNYWNIGKLVKWSREDLLRLFKTCSAPSPEEMEGEFPSRYPIYSEEDKMSYYANAQSGFGEGSVWLGKAYSYKHKIGKDMYEGYNCYHRDGKVYRYARFAWKIEASDYDGRPSLVMYYKYFSNCNAVAKGLRDEVRRVKPHLYLCIAHNEERPNPPFSISWNFEKNQTDDEVFFLQGPFYPWIGVDDADKEPFVL